MDKVNKNSDAYKEAYKIASEQCLRSKIYDYFYLKSIRLVNGRVVRK